MARIGFVGLGHMGLPMAVNLVKAGHTVTGFDLNQTARQALVQAGAKEAESLAELAPEKDVLITMLQSGDQIKTVWLEENGLLAHASPQTLLIDSSSIDVLSARSVHEAAARQHLLAVDAPVSGGVAGAAAGTLTFMVGGEEPAYTQAHPILSHMGKTIIHKGQAGSGQAAKMCNNMILGVSMTAISEAFILAKALGLSPQKLFDVVTHASGECWAMTHYVPVPDILPNVPANKNYQPGFTAAMMLKDLKLSQDSAKSVHIHTPIGERATALYQTMVDQGLGMLDFSAIINMLGDSK